MKTLFRRSNKRVTLGVKSLLDAKETHQDIINHPLEESELTVRGEISVGKDVKESDVCGGVDWCVVLDLSSSMGVVEDGISTSRLERAITALEELIKVLREHDRLCIVIFHNTAETLFPMEYGTTENKNSWLDKLWDARYKIGGQTNLSEGLERAFDAFEGIVSYNSQLAIFCDGDINKGVKESNDLIKLLDIRMKACKRAFGMLIVLVGEDNETDTLFKLSTESSCSESRFEQFIGVEEEDAMLPAVFTLGHEQKRHKVENCPDVEMHVQVPRNSKIMIENDSANNQLNKYPFQYVVPGEHQFLSISSIHHTSSFRVKFKLKILLDKVANEEKDQTVIRISFRAKGPLPRDFILPKERFVLVNRRKQVPLESNKHRDYFQTEDQLDKAALSVKNISVVVKETQNLEDALSHSLMKLKSLLENISGVLLKVEDVREKNKLHVLEELVHQCEDVIEKGAAISDSIDENIARRNVWYTLDALANSIKNSEYGVRSLNLLSVETRRCLPEQGNGLTGKMREIVDMIQEGMVEERIEFYETDPAFNLSRNSLFKSLD